MTLTPEQQKAFATTFAVVPDADAAWDCAHAIESQGKP
jgi:hypothetical protein